MGANDLRDSFDRADILVDTYSVGGSHTYLPYGWSLRNKYIKMVKDVIEGLGYSEWNFSDLIAEEDLAIMNSQIMNISGKVMSTSHGKDEKAIFLAPTHEISVNRILQQRIQNESDLPLRLFHTGSAFRKPKQNQFPFNLGERRSYVEAYGVFGESVDITHEFERIKEVISSLIANTLVMPSVNVDRPLATNNPISKQTNCSDILTPFGKTQIAGMLYLHDTIFTQPFGVRYRSPGIKKKKTPRTIHFGFSDNLLLGTLLNTLDEDGSFKLPISLLPHQVLFLVDSNQENNIETGRHKKQICRSKNESHKYFDLAVRQGYLIIVRKTDKGSYVYLTDKKTKLPIDQIENLDDLVRQVAVDRSQSLEKVKQDKLAEGIIFSEGDDINIINTSLKSGKIVTVPLFKSDQTVVEFEKNLACGEVLGFKATHDKMKCAQTGQETTYMAYVSRRF